jgi:hypothetical protein
MSAVSQPDRVFDLAKKLMPYSFGSLWWARDDLIQQVQDRFVHRADRIGHPLLSIKRGELRSRHDAIPMLVGTSGTNLREKVKRRCVQVRALTAAEPAKISYFGSIVGPGMYGFEDLLDGMIRKSKSFRTVKKGSGEAFPDFEPVHWFEIRAMVPNGDKPHVDDSERLALEKYCKDHNL